MAELILSMENFSFRYAGAENCALQDINLSLKPGEFISLTGPSGCGKSTLSYCLTGIIPAYIQGETTGRVLILGRDSRHLSPPDLAGLVGLVQQDPEAQLCTLMVQDEVAFGPENIGLPREEIRERVNWALAAVQAAHLSERQVYTLSGGEKQRVAIASMLAMHPALLVLDEPTANLDPIGTIEVLEAISHLRRDFDTAVIVIEHRLESLLKLSDRLVFMQDGRIIADGPPLSVMAEHPMMLKKDFPRRSAGSKKAIVSNSPSSAPPLLRAEGLTLSYSGHTVWEDLNFALHSGETVALMGANGSGKSSLLFSLLGTLKLAAGYLYWQDDPMAEKVAQRARQLGLIFQNPNHQIFEHTVWREACLPVRNLVSKDFAHEPIAELLDDFDLLRYRDTLPFSLSLGEKKRLTLVAVLAYAPKLLLLDEPLMGQDNSRLLHFWEAVEEHRQQGGASLIVCHEPEFVLQYCDRLLFLQGSRLIVDAPVVQAFEQLYSHGLTMFCPEVESYG